jgi:cyclophilin family peptidyl-prolyl cis-trans isomerase
MSDPVVEVVTNHGAFAITLDPTHAPKSVENFLRYVDAQLEKKPVTAPIQNEADNGLKNTRGTVAMARTSEPHSATAQWFVNVVDNGFLDHTAKDERGWGYAVFGKVTEGMNVVDKIRDVKTGAQGPFSKDCPVEAVAITSVRRR